MHPSIAAAMLVTVASIAVVASQCAAQSPGQPAMRPIAASSGSSMGTPSDNDRGTAMAGQSSRESRAAAISALPMDRLTAAARQRIASIVDRPTLYRHLPSQTLNCDPELFLFIARQPEILVGIWEVMGITQVRTERMDEYRLQAKDGAGTNCTIDLIYGDRSTHVYVADGYYDGKLVAAPLTGKGVFILRTDYVPQADGLVLVQGTLDCFIQLDNLGADLIARTFGPLIGRTADNNFAETARFIEQIGSTARNNPEGLQELGSRLPQVDELTRRRFVENVFNVDRRNQARIESRSLPRAAERSDEGLTLR